MTHPPASEVHTLLLALQTARLNAPQARRLAALLAASGDASLREDLFVLTQSTEPHTAFNALWVCTLLPPSEAAWLQSRQGELIDCVMQPQSSGLRRLRLCLLERMDFCGEAVRVDFLDFCLTRFADAAEPPACKALCLKLAHKLCHPYPELLDELRRTVKLLPAESLPPAVRAALRHLPKATK